MYQSNISVRILGIGNILMGDDGVGIKVIEKLSKIYSDHFENVEIIDAGVCCLDILNQLEDVDKVIIVDSIKSGAKKGSIIRLEGTELLNKGYEQDYMFSIHDMGLLEILILGKHIQELPEIIIYGIEIGNIKEEISIDLTPEVLDSVDRIIPLILQEIAK